MLRQHLVAPKGPLQGANDGVHCNAFFSFKGKRGEWVADAASESRLKIWEKEEGGGGKCIRRGRGGGGRAGERRGSGESSDFLGWEKEW